MRKFKKGLIIAALAAVTLLAACNKSSNASSSSNSGASTSVTTYNNVYGTDPTTLDYTVSSRATNSSIYANFVDGLLENNKYGELIPALAKSWSVSKDGLTYTYKLRKGVSWVDSEGNKVATVKAQDFVTGLKHAVAAKSETLYVVQNSIKGLNDYVTGKQKDFSKVGVKAVDDYTVQYTLNQPESYWNSKTTYGVLFPVNAKFLSSEGKDFGSMKASSILYNGGYTLANFTAKSVIELKANPSYWDKKNVNIKTVKLTYNDGSNPDGLYKSFMKGEIDSSRVYPNLPGYKQVLKQSKNNIVWSDQDAAVYNLTFNLSRQTYNLTDKKTTKAKDDTKKAILNKDFRQAISFGFDKAAYNAQSVGEAGSKKSLRNEMTPPDFVTINGQKYGTVLQKDLQSLDPSTYKDIDLADGHDATYNPTKAKELIASAKKALTAEGVSFPIHLDIPVEEKAQNSVNAVKSLKSSIEQSLGKDNVQIDIQYASEDKYLAATYQATTGKASDFDISNASGWSPDYDDPSTYLDIYDPSTGSMLNTIGLEASATVQGKDETADAKKAVGMDKYAALVKAAEVITNDTNARYAAFAKAEAYLLDMGIQIPIYSGGGAPGVTKVVPYTAPFSWSGLGGNKYKFTKLQKEPVTAAQKAKAKAAWSAKRAEIAKKAATND
ncbi:peptide ABC transporter substrate-binding protein [Schleiferilactobacillus shenzhenensis]|uniref:SarA n=1 Tax=Schleiferilactobacillus shenzhenensis LY-73 TaxID=1231336 RepID=U4TLX2_9LACO|nr:peptide ABC transporter substrate-binding protein [Schleiferilactobacillus shenzhenensis]ERL65214.1 SarA [Schleiferilactobacillus shenzhenensis LY-73]